MAARKKTVKKTRKARATNIRRTAPSGVSAAPHSAIHAARGRGVGAFVLEDARDRGHLTADADPLAGVSSHHQLEDARDRGHAFADADPLADVRPAPALDDERDRSMPEGA